MNNVALGQYFPGNSRIHRLDPRTKLLLLILYIVVVFLIRQESYLHILLYIPVFAFLALCVRLSQVPLSYFVRSLKPMRFILIFMFLLNFFFTSGEEILFRLGFITVYHKGLLQGIYIVLRLILLVGGTSVMTLTTSPTGLTDGLERLLSPLAKIHFPAHELAMMMTIALRFIPTLMEEADKIKKAQTARGANFDNGSLVQRAKSMLPILVPLFVSAFRRADELAMAMESRCYHGGEGRTRMHQLHFHRGDGIAALSVVLLGVIIVLIQELVL